MSKQQVVNEIHKPLRKNFVRRRFIQKGYNDTWQIDLVEMIPFSKLNNGYKYIFTGIDTFSKYAFAYPVKSKKSIEIMFAMKKMFEQFETYPINIQSDQGKEFFNKDFKFLMQKHKINHYHTYTHLKASICERFNRTLKNLMWKMFSMRGTYKWIDEVDNLIHRYNNTYHRTIKMKPSEVNKSNEEYILQKIYNFPKSFPHHKFKKGDHVRISRYKGIFFKGYEPNWTTEIFVIYKVNVTNPVTYLIKDYKDNAIEGSFYEYELQIVKDKKAFLVEKVLKRRGTKLFVKWLGFDDTHNTWINKKELLK